MMEHILAAIGGLAATEPEPANEETRLLRLACVLITHLSTPTPRPPTPARILNPRAQAPSPGGCKDRGDSLQVFGDILYTSGHLVTSGSEPRKSTSAMGCVMNQTPHTPSADVGRSATGYPRSARPTLNP